MKRGQGGDLKHEAMEVTQQRLGADERGEHGVTWSANSSRFKLDVFVPPSCMSSLRGCTKPRGDLGQLQTDRQVLHVSSSAWVDASSGARSVIERFERTKLHFVGLCERKAEDLWVAGSGDGAVMVWWALKPWRPTSKICLSRDDESWSEKVGTGLSWAVGMKHRVSTGTKEDRSWKGWAVCVLADTSRRCRSVRDACGIPLCIGCNEKQPTPSLAASFHGMWQRKSLRGLVYLLKPCHALLMPLRMLLLAAAVAFCKTWAVGILRVRKRSIYPREGAISWLPTQHALEGQLKALQAQLLLSIACSMPTIRATAMRGAVGVHVCTRSLWKTPGGS